MRNDSAFSILITAWIAVPSLTLFLSAGLASAQPSSGNYAFVVATGFLCDPGDSGSCPAVVRSANGDSFEISGAGTFNPQNKSVEAAGTFHHKSRIGSVIESGIWIANELMSFGSYGIAPTALSQQEPAFGDPQPGPKRLLMGPSPTGGLAIFRILLMPLSRTAKTATLEVNCALGDVPRERSVEGVRLTIERDGGEFSEEVSGRVMFLLMRAGVTPSSGSRQKEFSPASTETPRN